MRFMLPKSWPALAFLLLAHASNAQNLDYDRLEELFGEPVTTSFTGSPQRESDVPVSMLIVTADEIRRSGARDIPGILSHLAGIEVDRTSREYADVAIRGYNQAFTPRLLVLVDGRQVYADYYGFTPWSTIPVELDAIRQIEIVKGPSGALFGFNAVGGVVNIVTDDPMGDKAGSSLSVRAGTPELAEVSAIGELRFGDKAALRLSAGTRSSDEFSTARQPADIETPGDNRRDAFTADARISLAPNVSFGIDVTHSAASQIEMPPTYTMSLTEYETNSVRADWQAETGRGLVKANIYKNTIKANAYLAGSPDPIGRFDNDVVVAQIEDLFKVGAKHILRVAGEYRDNSMPTTPIGGANVHYDLLALTTMWNWQPTPMISLTNAVRIDSWQLGRDGYLPPQSVTGVGFSNALWDVRRDEISFNTGLSWEMTATSALKFSAGRARQLPNLLSLGGDFSSFAGLYFVGAPTLEPTDISNYELRWERQWPASGLRLGLGAFHGDTTDVQSLFFGNLGSSATDGVELLVGGTFDESWGWDFSLLAQALRDDLNPDIPAEATYVDFERTTPRRLAKAHLSWTHGSWEVDTYLRYRSASQGLRGPNPGDFLAYFVDVPAYTALDARVARALTESLRLELAGRNLTHASQRQTSAPEVEREVTATLRYTF